MHAIVVSLHGGDHEIVSQTWRSNGFTVEQTGPQALSERHVEVEGEMDEGGGRETDRGGGRETDRGGGRETEIGGGRDALRWRERNR